MFDKINYSWLYTNLVWRRPW